MPRHPTASRHDYVSSHPEMFYKKVFLKVLQNSQEKSCAEVSFSCNFKKNKALELVISYEFCEIALASKQKRQMFSKKVCICFEYI